MARSDGGRQPVPITPGMRARVARNAPAAIARRGGGFWIEQWIALLHWVAVATTSLAGLLLLGWSPLAMLAFLLASAWLNVAGDLLRWLLFRRRVHAFAETFSDDAEVWAVALALHSGKQSLPPEQSNRYAVGIGLFVDLAFGGVATAVMLLALQAHGVDLWTDFRSDGPLRWTLLAIIALQVLGLCWALLSHAVGSQREVPMKVTPGARGLGLFILMFLVMGAGDEGRQLWLPLVIANGLLMLLGAVGLFGLLLMLRDHPRALAALAALRREAPRQA